MKDTEAQNAITGGALERLINVLEEQNKIRLPVRHDTP